MNWGLQLYYESKVAQVKLIPNLVTVIISAFRVNILVITGILVLVNAILWFRAGTFFKETEELQDDNYQIMSELRDYVNLSKNMWINGTTNLDYFGNTFNRYLNNSTTIAQSYRTLELLNGATVFGVALYLAWTNYAKSTPADFFVYLLIYKIQAQLGKLNRRFQMVKDLFKKAPQVPQLSSRGEVQKIKIQELVNQTPLLRVSTPLEFQRGDHVLVHGKSGAGKTTFFNLWKGILMPEKAKVSLDDTMMPHGFHSFSDDIYYTIQSFKDLPRASLVDVVTNYSPAPNLDLVRKCLETACLDELYNVDKNPMVLASDDYSRLSL
jgi:ABC-type transport system involved in cytochrome bd biosynthesis fused ATPase/permease subunit